MRRAIVTVTAVWMVGVMAGCASTRFCRHTTQDPTTKVTVRFVVPPDQPMFSSSLTLDTTSARLVGDPVGGFSTSTYTATTSGANLEPQSPNPYHVVLWGGSFQGDDVTYHPAALTPGSYMFGLLDQQDGTLLQGWIGVNHAGDDLLSVLTEWRDTIHAQQQWLGFENKIVGNFASRNADEFANFQRELSQIKRLERKIESVIRTEIHDRIRRQNERNSVLESAEILLMPGPTDFFRPSTLPTFRDAELASAREGQPVTKVVLMADYPAAMEKLRLVTNLRDDLKRCRFVLSDEIHRLENQHRYFTMTDHLYHHGRRFAETTQNLQVAWGLMQRLDQQIGKLRQKGHALMFVAGLFSPTDSFNAFEEEERNLQRERIVLQEQKHQTDAKFEQMSETNERRVGLERTRQEINAAIEAIDQQDTQINQARLALNELRDSTGIIHRHGPWHVVTATYFDQDIPTYLADAVERESLMTIRLQSTDSLYAPGTTGVAGAAQPMRVVPTSWRNDD